jgi:hypothetical protein
MKRRWTCGIVVVVLLALLVGVVVGVHLGAGQDFISRHAPWLPYPPPAPRKPGPLHVAFTQEQLTEQLRKAMKGHGEGLTVGLKDGLIILDGRAGTGEVSTPVHAEMVPFADAGRVSLHMKKVKIGSLPLPGEAGQSLANYAAHALALQQDKTPGLFVDTVEVRPGQLVITGHISATLLAHPRSPR